MLLWKPIPVFGLELYFRFKAGRVFITEVLLRQDVSGPVDGMNTMLDELDMMFLRNKPFLAGLCLCMTVRRVNVCCL